MEELLREILITLKSIDSKLSANTAETLPDLVSMEDIKKYLKIGTIKAYEILNNSKFTPISDGRKKCIPKVEFLQFLERQHKLKKLKI